MALPSLPDPSSLWFKRRKTDYGSDHLNYFWLARLLVFLSITSFAMQNVKKAVSCSLPAAFPKDKLEFVENQCTASSSYFYTDLTQENRTLDYRNRRSYYNYFPIHLLIAAVAGYLPHALWHWFLKKFADQVFAFINGIADQANKIGFSKEATSCFTTLFVQLVKNRKHRNTLGGSLLSWCYFLVKVMYLGNSVLQLYLMKSQLGIDWNEFMMFGVNAILNEPQFEERLNVLFPSVTTCFVMDYDEFVFDVIVYPVCAMNLMWFYKYTFVLLWFVTLEMLLVNFVDALSTFFWILCKDHRSSDAKFYLMGHTSPGGGEKNKEKRVEHTSPGGEKLSMDVQSFVTDFMQPDGLLFLNLLKSATDERVCSVICRRTFKECKGDKKELIHASGI